MFFIFMFSSVFFTLIIYGFQHTHHPQFASKQFTNSSVKGMFGDALNELDWAVGQVFQASKDANIDDDVFLFLLLIMGEDYF